jgi:hypothetical protein
MKIRSRGICAALILSGALSLVSPPLAAQNSKPEAAPKEPTPPAGRVENSQRQGESRKSSSEESRLPIPADVPKADRVDPGK